MEERIKELLEEKNYKVLKIELSEMNNSDLAEILEEFEPSELVTLFRLMKKDDQVEVFALLESNFASELLSYFTDKEKVSLIEEMATDDAVDVLEEMPANIVDKLLKKCDAETRKDVNKLLNYKEDSAGSIMTVEYAEIKGSATVKQAIDYLRKEQDELETINYLFVVDDKRKLNGIVHLKDLVFASGKDRIKKIMEEIEVYAITSMDQEEVASLFQKYDITIMPVVDSEKRLVGIITIDDVVDVLQEEATEDMEKMAAILPGDKPYDKTSVFETFKARIPWLLLLMVSATFTGAIITGFESKLASMTILTAFIPMLMDTGGNAGGQSSVSIIRALSLNQIEFKDIFRVVFKEFRVAILCSIVLGICNFIKLMLLDRVGVTVALAVCTTLCITVIIAKFIGTILPICAKKIGFDPAVMASPFITTIVDACSLLVYFQVATMILGL